MAISSWKGAKVGHDVLAYLLHDRVKFIGNNESYNELLIQVFSIEKGGHLFLGDIWSM